MSYIDTFNVVNITYHSANLIWYGSYNTIDLYYSENNDIYNLIATGIYDSSYNLTNLNESTLYYYKVIPYDINNNEGTHNIIFFTTSTKPIIRNFWAEKSTPTMIPLYTEGTYYKYDVYYKKYIDPQFYFYSTVVGKHNVLIHSLIPDTSYNFYIIPYDVYDTSGTTSSIITSSTDYTPYITNLYLGTCETNSILLNCTGKFTYITIQKSIDNIHFYTDVKLYIVDTSNSSFAIDSSLSVTTLYPYTTYYFKIIPYSTNYNAGVVSNTIYATTLMGIDLIETYGHIYNNSATIYWEGIYTRILIYRKLDDTAIVVADLYNDTNNITTGTYTYNDLYSYKTYNFYIQPYNGDTKTSISDILTVTTDFSAQVGIFTKAQNNTHNSIILYFDANNYIFPYYNTALIQISIDNTTFYDVSLITQHTSLSNNVNYTVTDLSSNFMYYFRVYPYSLYDVSGDFSTTFIATKGNVIDCFLTLDNSNQIVINCTGYFNYANIIYFDTSFNTYINTIYDISYIDFPYTIDSNIISSEYTYSFYIIPYNIQDISGISSSIIYNPVITTFYISDVSNDTITLTCIGKYNSFSLQTRLMEEIEYTDVDIDISSSIIINANTSSTNTSFYRIIPYNVDGNTGLITNEIFIPTINYINFTYISTYDISITWTGNYSFFEILFSTNNTDFSTLIYSQETNTYINTNLYVINDNIISSFEANNTTYYFKIIPYSYGTGIDGNTILYPGLTSNTIYNSTISNIIVLLNPDTPTYRIQIDFSGNFYYAQLYYREDNENYTDEYALISYNNYTFTIGALKSNTTYFLKLRHFNDMEFEGIMTDEISITTQSLLYNLYPDYDISLSTSNSIFLTWNNNGFYSYIDIYDYNNDFIYSLSNADTSFNTSGIQTNLLPNTEYTYTLKLYDDFGNMEFTTVTAYTNASTKNINITSYPNYFIFTWDNTDYNTITIQNITTMSAPIIYTSNDTAVYNTINNEFYQNNKSINTNLLPDTEYNYLITVTNIAGGSITYNITATTISDYSIPMYSMDDIQALTLENMNLDSSAI